MSRIVLDALFVAAAKRYTVNFSCNEPHMENEGQGWCRQIDLSVP